MTELFLISFLALYFEVLFIRWVPSSVQAIAFFPNVILISAFLGLGIGCFLAERKRQFLELFPLLTLGYIILLTSYTDTTISLVGFSAKGAHFLVALALVFSVNALVFIPLGQKLGRCLKRFKPLTAYAINIAGSILGVAVFSCMAYLWIKPVYWFLLGFGVLAWFYRNAARQLLLQIVIFTLALFMVAQTHPYSRWSPYYRVDILPITPTELSSQVVGFKISVNDLFHQNALDLREQSVRQFPDLQNYKRIYEFPYRLAPVKNTLILGAGSGNDAAAALRMGVGDITAVEIDPFIASLGESLHPEKPYAEPTVRLCVDDARSFIKKTDKKFDLVTFGYLDAHKVFSQFSSVRLDNFIYTRESFAEIKKHLSDGGTLCLTYLLFKDWLGAKLYATLKEVFGDDLRVFRTSTYGAYDDTVIFLAGPGARKPVSFADPHIKPFDGYAKTSEERITDDWPYLYLTKKSIPFHYLAVILMMAGISLIAVMLAHGASLPKFDMHFFFLGAGFMLLETVSITRCALLFGSTWIVNSVVIVAILCMILLSCLYVERARRIPVIPVYLLLGLSLFWNWLIGPGSYAFALPVLFASIIFASSFKKAKNIPMVFAYNLLGAIAGGCLEYFSMLAGFRVLYVLIILVYFLSFLGLALKREIFP